MAGVKVLRPFTIQERDRINIRIIHPDFKNCILHLNDNIDKIVSVTLTTSHIETVCLLSHQSKKFAQIKVDTEDLVDDNSLARPTYENIKKYILNKFGVKMHTLYIAQVKRKYGLPMRECCHKSKNEDYVQDQVTPEQEEMIVDALKHFKAIK